MQLEKKLAEGAFVVLAEMEPPKGVEVAGLVSQAMAVRGKVDAFVVPEMSSAVMRLSSLGVSLLLASRGLETVMQVCCRDRNRLALQADLLAAGALGIPNVMGVAGDDITFGDHHTAKAVDDLTLEELLQGMNTLMTGRDLAGIELKGAPRFFVGSTVNPGAAHLEAELAALDRKLAAGARFFITPPIFSVEVLDAFRKRAGGRPMYLLTTVLLLKSVGMARYIQRHLGQIQVPEALVSRIQKAPERVRECVQIAAELVKAFKDRGVSGVVISTLGWEDRLPAILSAAGI
ncbi:MAG: 5,10-methylenetetrahydrofolate reductase [Deltaproteobacteria bacterium]|nr:5,10-methylenetetrahydrofolate reductase [Deltaproteobacteria bacterium]